MPCGFQFFPKTLWNFEKAIEPPTAELLLVLSFPISICIQGNGEQATSEWIKAQHGKKKNKQKNNLSPQTNSEVNFLGIVKPTNISTKWRSGSLDTFCYWDRCCLFILLSADARPWTRWVLYLHGMKFCTAARLWPTSQRRNVSMSAHRRWYWQYQCYNTRL